MKVAANIIAILDASTIEGDQLRLPNQLDRNVYTAVMKVVEAAGGKWNRKAKAHVFAAGAADVIDQVILTGEITTHQDMQQFFTPPDVADRVINRARIRSGQKIYEPSAGGGALIRAVLKITNDVELFANEIDPVYHKALRTEFWAKFGAGGLGMRDFLTYEPNPVFDRIVMNPPFKCQADIRHVSHALKFLKEDGGLVAVMAAGVMFRENKLAVDFRNDVISRGGYFERLPEGSFKPSGTLVSTCLVVTGKGGDAAFNLSSLAA